MKEVKIIAGNAGDSTVSAKVNVALANEWKVLSHTVVSGSGFSKYTSEPQIVFVLIKTEPLNF